MRIQSQQRCLLFLLHVSFAVNGVLADSFAPNSNSFAAATSHYAASEWTEALAAFELCLAKPLGPSESAVAQFYAAECEVQLGKTNAALSRYRELVREDISGPYRSYAHFRIGEAASRAGDTEVAERELTEFLQWQEDSVYRPYAYLILGESAAARGDWSKARHVLSTLLEEYPEHEIAPQAKLALAQSLLELGQGEGAIAVVAPLAEMREHPLASAALVTIARAQFARQDFSLAIVTVDQLKSQFPDAMECHQAKVIAGWSHWKLAEYKPILALTDDLDLGEPYYAELLTLRGLTDYALENWAAAANELSEATKLLPGRIHLSYYASESFRRAGQKDKARRLFESILSSPATELADTRIDSWDDDALWALAQMAASEGDLIGSGKMIERIRTEYPGSPYADSKVADQASTQARLLVEAINHQRDARYDAALSSYEQLIEYCQEIDQPVGEALYQQAKLLSSLDQVEAARRCFQQCVAQGPANPQYLPASLALGQLDQSMGRHRQATEHYQNVITEAPQTLPAQEARYRLAKMLSSQQDSTFAPKLLREILETEVTEANLLDRQRTRLTELRQHAREGLIQGHAKLKEWAAVRDHAAGQIASIAEGPLRLSAEFWLAESEYRLGNDAEAKESFSQVDRRSHSSQPVWTAMAPLRLAQIAARQSNWLEVLSLLAGFRTQHPQFPLLHEADYLVGRALAGRGRMSEARSSYQAVLDNALADGTETAVRSQWMIGETFFHQEKYDLARDAYQRVIAEHGFPEWRVRAALQAGKCSELLGEWNQAQGFYETTLKQDSEIEASSELAARLRWTQQQLASRKQRIK